MWAARSDAAHPHRWQAVAGLLFSLVGYWLLAYATPRTQFVQLIVLFGGLFAVYGLLVRYFTLTHQVTFGVAIALVFRLVWLLALPALSDDYVRFVWDGRLLTNGINPYSVVPREFIATADATRVGVTPELFAALNSPDYHSVYPPVLQAIFAFGAWLFPDSITGHVVAMRLFIIAAEVGACILIIRLLHRLRLPSERVLWYALNPLVIAELTGNLHFEAVLIFCLLLAVWWLMHDKIAPSALAWALAVGTKLLPLIFLPFLLRRLSLNQWFLFFGTFAVVLFGQFVPFLNRMLLANIFSSLDLYFQKFEFNASVYYLVRWVGFRRKGYNIIAQAGKWLSATILGTITALAVFEKKPDISALFRMMLASLSVYYLLATTVHAWYVTPLIAVTLFTPYRYSIVWSAMVMVSYATYATSPYRENLWLTALEYVVVIGYAGYEWLVQRKKMSLSSPE